MIFDPPAKSRRRVVGRFLWPLLIVLAVVFAAVVSAAGDETRNELDYLDAISTQARELSRSGAAIQELMPRVREVDRNEFTTVFEGVIADLDAALAFVGEEPPTESLIPVWALYRQTLEAWNDGVNRLSEAVLHAADNPDDASVVNTIGDALGDLRAGDNLYLDLKVEFQREEIPDPVSPLVDVSLMPAEGGLLGLSNSYYAAARASTNGLGLRPGLTVSQVVADPLWETNVDNETVVPHTEAITFSAVVTNTGNVANVPETLTMTLTSEDAEAMVAQVEVPELAPAGQTTISFNPVEVEPETLYEVLLELTLTGPDANPNDNAIRVQFSVNPE